MALTGGLARHQCIHILLHAQIEFIRPRGAWFLAQLALGRGAGEVSTSRGDFRAAILSFRVGREDEGLDGLD